MPPCPLHLWALSSNRLQALEVIHCRRCGWLPLEALGVPWGVVEFLLEPPNLRFSRARKGTHSNLLSWLRAGPPREVEGVGWALLQGCLQDPPPPRPYQELRPNAPCLILVHQEGSTLRLKVVDMPILPYKGLLRLLGLLGLLSSSRPEEEGWGWDPESREVVGDRRRPSRT